MCTVTLSGGTWCTRTCVSVAACGVLAGDAVANAKLRARWACVSPGAALQHEPRETLRGAARRLETVNTWRCLRAETEPLAGRGPISYSSILSHIYAVTLGCSVPWADGYRSWSLPPCCSRPHQPPAPTFLLSPPPPPVSATFYTDTRAVIWEYCRRVSGWEPRVRAKARGAGAEVTPRRYGLRHSVVLYLQLVPLACNLPAAVL